MIEKMLIHAPEYEDYLENKENISKNSLVFVEDRDKLITQEYEYQFVPSDRQNNQVLTSKNGVVVFDDMSFIKNSINNGVSLNNNTLKVDHANEVAIGTFNSSIEPSTAHVNWLILSGTWNESEKDDAFEGKLFTCISPGTNGVTKIKCTFKSVRTITFTYRSDAESTYDYLCVGHLDSTTPYHTSDPYRVVDTTQGKQNQWLSTTFTVDDDDEHFVEFLYGKDSSVDVQPDNAQVYISNIVELTDNAVFTMGNGVDDENRHNAFEVHSNGDVFISDTLASGRRYEKPMINLQEKLKEIEENYIKKSEIDEYIEEYLRQRN